MRKRKLILTILFLASSATIVSAQEKINTLTVDAGTYTYYEQGEWKKLIDLGKKSLKNGIDFYYLQYRLGVAYYQLKNYRKAAGYFETVLKETPKDVLAQEYLYYSYLFSGMYEDARVYGNILPPDMQKKLNIFNKPLIVSSLGAEFKYYLIDDYEADVKEGEILNQKILKNLWYSDLNLTSYIKKKIMLFQGFSYLNGKNKVFNPEYSIDPFDENLRQFQYYISANRNFSRGTNFKAALHYTNTTLEAPNPAATNNPGHGQGNNESKYLYSNKINGIAGFFKYSRNVSCFDLKATLTVSNFDKIVGTQYIPGAGVVWYPFGNTSVHLGGEIKYIFAGDVPDYDPGFVYKADIGVKLFKTVWLQPFMLYGESRNFTDEDAFVVYNSSNTINYWYGVNLNALLLKDRLFLYFSWQHYSLTNLYYIGYDKGLVDFNISTLLGGVKYRF